MHKEKDTILYVDDEILNLELFKESFEDKYDVITETSTKKAFNLINQHPVKVIISDLRMPEETGLMFLERVNKNYPDIIKIVFTAYLDYDAALNAINQGGIYRYLMKPWNEREIIDTLNTAIREYNLNFENKKLLSELKQKNNELEIAIKQIQENEQKFYNIFSNSNDGIIIINDDKLLEANPAFYKIICLEDGNYTAEAMQKHLKIRYNNFFERSNIIVKNNNPAIKEMNITTVNNENKYIELNSRIIDYKGQKAVLSIVRDITERKVLEQKIMEAIIQTQEEDQSRYARELHDGLGPILSTLKMYIEWMVNEQNTINREKIMQQSIYNIDEAISRLKEIANNLSPHVLQRFGLINALQTYTDQVKSAINIDIVISSNILERLPVNIEITLYRIMLECINNSLKHAQAKKILIKFRINENILAINYSDNGKGFNVEKTMKEGKGMGLYNIENRVKLIGGELRLKSNINIGTDIEIIIKI